MAEGQGACALPNEDHEEDCTTPPATMPDCPKCATPYNTTSQRPKLLPCNHTVCKACLITCKKDLECSVCHSVTNLADGDIQTDFMILRAICPPDVMDDLHNSLKEVLVTSTNIEIHSDIDQSHKGDIQNSSRKSSSSSASYSDDICSPFQSSSQSNADMVQELLHCQFAEASSTAKLKLTTLKLQSELLQASHDTTVLMIDKDFDHLITVINRRRKLLKNQVEDIHSELQEGLEEDIERLSLNSMCLDSLKQHSRLIMKGDGERLQGSYHQVAAEISELKENIDQVLMDGAACIHFDIKDKVKDFERSLRTLGKVQTGANVPVFVEITATFVKINEESKVFIAIKDAAENQMSHFDCYTLIDVSIENQNVEAIDSQLLVCSESSVHDANFVVSFVPSALGQHCLKVTFCDIPLPVCKFSVTDIV